nr:hypothetical protein Ahy_A01g001322 [Ipomoea batatas]GMD47405.1 hypothetical protein Ahy_A01g001322 [Ipomoea batatas]
MLQFKWQRIVRRYHAISTWITKVVQKRFANERNYGGYGKGKVLERITKPIVEKGNDDVQVVENVGGENVQRDGVFGYGHLACDCHQAFKTDVVSPGSFPALRLRRISSLMSTIFSFSCLTRSINDLSFSVGMRGPNPRLSVPSKPPPSNRLASLSTWSSSSSDIVAPVPSPGDTPEYWTSSIQN